MKVYENIASIYDNYDTFFVDVYGVLFNGVEMCEEAIWTLQLLKEHGKKVVILSNSTERSSSAKAGYFRRGLIPEQHYDEFITSGEYLHNVLLREPNEIEKFAGYSVRTVKCIFTGNSEMFKDTILQPAESINDADIMYIGVPRSSYGAVRIDNILDSKNNHVELKHLFDVDWRLCHDDQGRRGLAEFARDLDNCLQHQKALIVANPDIFTYAAVDNGRYPIICQGAIGKYYENIGGKVIYYGKPFNGVFDFAKSFVGENDKIIMIGDTPWTDIAGANASGIDSALLIQSGVSKEFLDNMKEDFQDIDIDKCFSKIASKFNCSTMDIKPTYVVSTLSI